jgi:dihydrofolate reductase
VSKLRVHNFALSIDGYGAGPNQTLDNPLGVGGTSLHNWVFETQTGRKSFGLEGGAKGVDDDYLAQGNLGIGATIMGRNMFGPVRGPWGSEQWQGWWGDDPPYHHPVFVLTHQPRPSISMEGGTVFHFVNEGIEVALERAVAAADGQDVRLGGGAATIQQYLRARLIDEIHVAIVPIFLGDGERLFDHLEGGPVGYECAEFVASESALHVRFVRSPTSP